jgi:hypothetical protein
MVSFFPTVETARDGGIGHGRLAARSGGDSREGHRGQCPP